MVFMKKIVKVNFEKKKTADGNKCIKNDQVCKYLIDA